MVTLVDQAYQCGHSPLPSSPEIPTHSRRVKSKRTKESGHQEQEELQMDVQRQAATSEFGKGDAPAGKQSSHAHCGSPLQRGEKRGGGGGAKRGSKQKR